MGLQRKRGPEKQRSFEEFFQGPEYVRAMETIRQLSSSSGLSKLNPVKLARYVRKMLTYFPEGFELEDFISLIFIFYQGEQITPHQRSSLQKALT